MEIMGDRKNKSKSSASVDDLVCFSHLRWNFVYQRPQHLLARAAKHQRVFFVEEPVPVDGAPFLEIRRADNVTIAVPHTLRSLTPEGLIAAQRELIGELFQRESITNFDSWYYTPMALRFTSQLQPQIIIYDCMDQLAGFKDAPPEIPALEEELFKRADIVFTGGQSLFESKKNMHSNIFAFPSSVDVNHYRSARLSQKEMADQGPRDALKLGYMGVIDERIDIKLIEEVARARPDWHLIMMGPVVKIDPATLPRLPNIHYIGPRQYHELPENLGSWDIGILPFAHNDATRFISPTKTLEYLAAGLRVISTSIRDVVNPYGRQGHVAIADDPQTFIAAAERMAREGQDSAWLQRVDQLLARVSWDRTFDSMRELIQGTKAAVNLRRSKSLPRPQAARASLLPVENLPPSRLASYL